MIDEGFFKVENRLKFDDITLEYSKLLHQNLNLSHRINNQNVTIMSLKEKNKSLCRQINFLNRAIRRYKHEKDS